MTTDLGVANGQRPSGTQPATFSYFKRNPVVHDHEKPFEIVINLPSLESNLEHIRRTNQEFEDHNAAVNDARSRESEFSLDEQGFCWAKWQGPGDWPSMDAKALLAKGNQWLQKGYLEPVEQFLHQELERRDGKPIDFVKVFDYKLRVSQDLNDFYSRTIDLEDGLDSIIPVTHPHIDQSPDGAVSRVRLHLGAEEASKLADRRFRIVNLWRPLKPVTNWPLALCDTRTVESQDLITTDVIRRKFIGESLYATHSQRHKWYYLSNQVPSEVTLLKIYDSADDIGSRFCLHSSFQVKGFEQHDRESFEVRAFVFDSEAPHR